MKRKVPPDGGYGWIIVFANAFSNFIIMPLINCFGLIFKDAFSDLGLSAAEGSLIINVNGAFGMMVGLLIGALLKIYGLRKIALVGAFLLTLGVVLMAYATTLTHFIITYGLITSLGIWMSESAYTLAVNVYFKEKRSKAMSLAVTFTGLGPVLIPQLLTLLLKHYTVGGVTLIFGGICANVFVAAMLLQPVAWHMKEIEVEDVQQKQKIKKDKPKTEHPAWKRFLKNMSKTFDLDLFKDPIFVNIMIGMSFAIFAELNFTVLTPFMLKDYGLTTQETATFLSTLGITDIIFRFIAPYIGDYFTQPPRLMYVFSLFLLILTRFAFLLSNNFHILLVTALGLGVAKGIRKVYMNLVIPAHVPLEKLSSAAGMELMANGLFVLIGGPLLGLVRDLTDSYTLSVIIMNCVTFTTIVMWGIEVAVIKVNKCLLAKSQEQIVLKSVQSLATT